MNRLSGERSPYLRHASTQKINWYPWGDEAFEASRLQGKAVFLSTGAIWCHWCHVMARESFENEEIAALLNKYFISVKLDRDERPDIDRRYQMSVAALGGGGGWPLSVFLTQDRKPFFGGTYFPPEDSMGRPGFKKVLRAIASLYSSKRNEIGEYSQRLMDSMQPVFPDPEKIKKSQLQRSAGHILTLFDHRNGGFGQSPKFPMPGAIEFLLNRFFLTGDNAIGDAVKKTLEAMAKGGIHDQIGGGFHRYSVDEAWTIPHFEKMADDNAWLLRNYIDAYRIFGSAYFKQVAGNAARFIKDTLAAPDGGFFASQDADVTPDDEGGYFTWTDNDFRRILSEDEYRVLSLHLLDERGSMHHDKSKKVLLLRADASEISLKTGIDHTSIAAIIASGKKKLLKERNRRETPFIDRTLYASLNGMMAASCLIASPVLEDPGLKEIALNSLRRINKELVHEGELLHTHGIRGVLDDYVFFTEGLVSAYETTGEPRYLDQAEHFLSQCITKFWDGSGGGFFDTEDKVLDLRLKSVEDIPHPSSNSRGILLLLKLFHMTGKDTYQHHAKKALEAFSPHAREAGVHAGCYFTALDAYFRMLKLTLRTKPGSTLAMSARSAFYPYKSILYEEGNGMVIPCIGDTCYEPIRTSETLKAFLEQRKGVTI